jgi:hypothetical protein
MKNLVLIGALLLISSCASDPYRLSEDAKKVELLQRKPKDNECEVVAKVTGEHNEGSERMARNMAINKAADADADSIYFDETVPNGSKRKVMATAYICNK